MQESWKASTEEVAHDIELLRQDAEHEGEIVQEKSGETWASHGCLNVYVVEFGDYGEEGACDQATDCQSHDCPTQAIHLVSKVFIGALLNQCSQRE